MEAIIDAISEIIDEHWVKFVTAGAFMLVGWSLGKWRARRQWEKKEFMDRLNVSLNIIQDGKLMIRTLIEKEAADIFLNEAAVQKLKQAAQKTSSDNPIIPFAKADYWFFLNSVLNEISEKFAFGQLQRDNGVPVKVVTYLICLTNECDGAMRTRKIRAMVIRKELLSKLPEEKPKFESHNHERRWITLLQLAKAYETTPHQFHDVEICI